MPETDAAAPHTNRPAYSLRATLKAIRHMHGTDFPVTLPGVHPIASFFILKRLKRLGFSDCTVAATGRGLVVSAHR